jgi:hypothetical protein
LVEIGQEIQGSFATLFLSGYAQYSEEVLLELGYRWDEIGAMRAAGAV